MISSLQVVTANDYQTIVLERASKLAFLDPDESSDYARGWAMYHANSPAHPETPPPPAWLDQPQHRSPKDFAEVKLALEQVMSHMGPDGIFPVDRRRTAEIEGAEEPSITPHTVMIVRGGRRCAMSKADVCTYACSIINLRRSTCFCTISIRLRRITQRRSTGRRRLLR